MAFYRIKSNQDKIQVLNNERESDLFNAHTHVMDLKMIPKSAVHNPIDAYTF